MTDDWGLRNWGKGRGGGRNKSSLILPILQTVINRLALRTPSLQVFMTETIPSIWLILK